MIKLLNFIAILFQDRPEVFNYKIINNKSDSQLKESVNKFINGSLGEEEINKILKENNIDPNINSVIKNIF